MRAEESRADLVSNVNQLLESSKDVARRLMTLEDNFDARSILSKRRSLNVSLKLGHAEDDATRRFLSRLSAIEDDATPQPAASPSSLPGSELTPISGFDFEPDLEASRVYRRVQREAMDFSFRSSVAWSNDLSVFSGLTLGDISVMSVIALPICAAEISNAHHYTFANREPLQHPIPTPATKFDELASGLTVHSLLYGCLEIAIQLSRITGFSGLWQEGLYSTAEHPFTTLQRIFSHGYPFLMVLDTLEAPLVAGQWETSLHMPSTDLKPFSDHVSFITGDTFDFAAMLENGDTGFLRVSLFGSSTLLMWNRPHGQC
jgi:cell division control protein 24